MDQNILVVEFAATDIPEAVRSIKMPTAQELEALDDCEDYLIINPLTNQVFVRGEWKTIPTGQIRQDNNIVMVV